jgi:hypothetical protein
MHTFGQVQTHNFIKEVPHLNHQATQTFLNKNGKKLIYMFNEKFVGNPNFDIHFLHQNVFKQKK